MKVIVPNNYWLIKPGFTGIAISEIAKEICFYKNGKIDNEKGPARIIYNRYIKYYYYKGFFYGEKLNNKFWIRLVKKINRQESLSLFK